jgi:hypothetical protein
MPETQTNKYTVIRDTREQEGQGWFFDRKDRCLGTQVCKLDTGDYSLVGYEKVFTIERKGAVAEWAKNLCEKRFERELQRMEQIEMPFILLEFDMDALFRWPEGSGIPRRDLWKVRTTPHFLVKRMHEYQCKYPYIHIIFAGTHGREIASSLFKRVVETWTPSGSDKK